MPKQRNAVDGTVKNALTNLRDLSRHVALIAQDDKTINKFVFFFKKLSSDNKVYEVLEDMSGESKSSVFVSFETLRTEFALVQEVLQKKEPSEPQYFQALFLKVSAQYTISRGVLGESTPQCTEYLGYITSRSL